MVSPHIRGFLAHLNTSKLWRGPVSLCQRIAFLPSIIGFSWLSYYTLLRKPTRVSVITNKVYNKFCHLTFVFFLSKFNHSKLWRGPVSLCQRITFLQIIIGFIYSLQWISTSLFRTPPRPSCLTCNTM